ncbi:MAG: PilW family protein [Pseudomonadales bacterium]|nr:PilW family protein [Pseudomonadales bacterium]
MYTRFRIVGREANRAAGFSLIELLLALALGLVIVAGIVQLFVGNSQTYAVMHAQARLQENGRFALDFISRAARSAGYFGCAPQPQNIVRGLRGNWALIPEFNITRFIDGHESTGPTAWAPTLNTLPRSGATNANVYIDGNGINTADVAPGTDIVAFRTLREPGRRLAQTLQPDAAPVVMAPGGDAGMAVNDIIMISNCEQGAVVRITGMAVAGDEAQLTLATSTTGNLYENADQVEGPNGLIPFSLSFLQRAYGEDTSVAVVETTYFFIAPSLAPDSEGNPVLALWQKVGSAGPVELVQGVENLQVLYGIDTTLNDGVPNANRYVPFNEVPDPNQVVSIRVTVTVNSVDPIAADGARLARTFSKTLQFRNSRPRA